MSPACDANIFYPMIILQMSRFCFKCDVKQFPSFTPNDYFFREYGKKAEDRGSKYASAIRKIMKSRIKTPIENDERT